MEKTKKVAPKLTHAGFWIRLLALFLDSFVVGVITSSLSALLFRASYGPNGFNFNFVPSILINFAYHAFFWINHDGQTIGKRLMGLKLVRQDGKVIDLNTAITRYIGYMLSGAVFCLGYISIAFNPKKLAWHDRLAKTYVIKVGDANKIVKIILIILMTMIVFFTIAGISLGFWGLTKFVSNQDKFFDSVNKLEQFGKNMEDFNGIEDLDMLEEEIEKLDPSGKLDIDINIDSDSSSSAETQSI